MEATLINSRKIRRLTKGFMLFVYAFFIFLICLFAFRKPYYNWDMLAYMAIVIKMDHHKDVKQIHSITYDIARKNIPPNEYGYLVASPYREKMATSPNDFYGQLPFYAVKPLYIGMIYLFYKVGFTLTISTVLPSILAYFMIGFLLFYWLKKYTKPIFAFIAGLLIMYSPFMVSIARISRPDSLSAFLLFAAFYFIIEKPSVIWVLIFFLLSVFTRIDNIVTIFFILSFLFFTRKWQKWITQRQYLLIILLFIASYFCITLITVYPFGWNVLYYPTFVQYYNLSRQSHIASPLKSYLELLYSGAITAIVIHHFTLFTLLALLIGGHLSIRLHSFSFTELFPLLLILIILVRFLLFPDLDDRFYISFYLCILVLLVKKYENGQVIQSVFPIKN